jgi:hypothetical protein
MAGIHARNPWFRGGRSFSLTHSLSLSLFLVSGLPNQGIGHESKKHDRFTPNKQKTSSWDEYKKLRSWEIETGFDGLYFKLHLYGPTSYLGRKRRSDLCKSSLLF